VSYPRKLYVESTVRCNLSCTTCIRNVLAGEQGDMSLSLFKRLLPSFRDADLINLSGFGEPLLNPAMLEMVRLTKEHCGPETRVGFNTNATLLTEVMAEELISAGLDSLVISIDGVEPETLKRVRVGARLPQLLANVERLARMKAEMGSDLPRVGFEFVAMTDNILELPQLVEVAGAVGVDSVIVSNLIPYTESLWGKILYDFNTDLAVHTMEKAAGEARKLNISLDLDDVTGYILKSNRFCSSYIEDRESDALCKLLDGARARAKALGVEMNLISLARRNRQRLEAAEKVFDEARAAARRLGLQLDLPVLTPRGDRRCAFVSDSGCCVSWDGFVEPCLRYMHAHSYYMFGRPRFVSRLSFGNVLSESLESIWNSEGYNRFRSMVSDLDMPSCVDCIYVEDCWYSLVGADCWASGNSCSACLWSRGVFKCL